MCPQGVAWAIVASGAMVAGAIVAASWVGVYTMQRYLANGDLVVTFEIFWQIREEIVVVKLMWMATAVKVVGHFLSRCW
jgi:hypothetical protein